LESQPISPDILNRFQAINLERYKIIIPTLLLDSVQEYIFAILFDESVDLLEEQVSPDKHRVDFPIC